MLLALDTASHLLGMALHNGQQILAEHAWHTTHQHSVELSPALDDMLAKAGLTPQDLSAVAVAQGPGSYTGLRIGLAVAKAMAQALHIPLIAVPTPDIVAAAMPYYKGSLYVAVEAGRGRVNLQRYYWKKGEWSSVDEPENTAWQDFLAQLERPVLISGEVSAAGQRLIETAHQQEDKPVELAPAAQRLRRAGYLAAVAHQRLATSEALGDPALVTPIYLNAP